MDRLAEIIDRINAIPQGRQNQINRLYKPYIHKGKGRGYRNYPSYPRGYHRGRGSYKVHMIEIKQDILQ